MIRMAILAIGFLGVTLGLVLFQPGARKPETQPETDVAVTRADPAIAPLANDPAAVAEPAVPALPAPVAAQRVANTDAAAALDDGALRRMTWSTLSRLNSATGRESAPGQPGSLLHTIVQRSLHDGGTAIAGRSGETVVAPSGGSTVGQRMSAGAQDVYVVQPGDSLVSIAERVYGDVNMTGPLFAANQSLLGRPDDLRAGQTLVLPRN